MSGKFTYPFRYVPSPEIIRAAQALISRIDSDPELHAAFAEGKMLGVLLVEGAEPLYAFSGLAGGRAVLPGFVPPIFDWTLSEAASSPGPERSAELQDWLFSNYVVSNARGESSTVKDIFARAGLVPPGGTGDCAGPKLLQYAYSHGLKPLAMGEFWYGKASKGAVREQGRFYPSCRGKCGPLLNFMLQGLDVEPNPLEMEYCGKEAEVVYEDASIVVMDKPSGMLAVPGRGEVLSLQELLEPKFGPLFSVHRLDMDTSGLIVFARDPESKAVLEEQFRNREVAKRYRALLDPPVTSEARRLSVGGRGRIVLPIAPDYYERPQQMVSDGGRPAITNYEVLDILPGGETEILFEPLSGRTHQLRVHSASVLGLGRTIKGDRLYGSPSDGPLRLRAEFIRFRHPVSGELISFSL